MNVKVKLNNLDYRYDVYHLVNIFYPLNNIEFVCENHDLEINISREKIICTLNEDTKIFCVDTNMKFKSFIKKALFEFFTYKTGKQMPWGTLIGIRPSKKTLELLQEGYNDDEIIEYFKYNTCTRRDKVQLCVDIAKNESKFVNKEKNSISVYIDMPFCPTRCLYCSFASNPIGSCKKIVEPYLNALYKEIDRMSKFIKEHHLKIECVYFGGGTPTSVSDEQFRNVMKNIHKHFVYKNDIKEFTVECGRPDSITLNKLKTMKEFNVNRISINPQSMNEKTLKLIGRNHTPQDIIDKFNMARKVGFDSINMDIIVGLPGENSSDIIKTCSEIEKLNPDNLTVHGLSVKRGSRLHENIINKKKFEMQSQEELNKMFNETVKLAHNLGMKPYYMYRQKNMVGNMENIGYTKEKKECIYNIEMIEERQTIIAVGADAVSKVIFLDENRIERFPNIKDVREYINRIDEKMGKKEKLLKTLYELEKEEM
ncbi:coproporphyrinogen III oxidase [Haloimpatiens sp. FM7330]|uniref:coproporphyrinogen III oxidase n=1 Tax=Haloimpatiens sp. FM7330 TaxID=3298610 RepID=UPI00362AE585